jgi:hypothetical protein
LAADDQQVVCGRVGAEPCAVILEKRARDRQIQVAGEHGGGVELDVRAGRGAGQPLEVGLAGVRVVLRRRVRGGRPVGGDGRPVRRKAPEVVVGRVVLLDHDHDALDGSHFARERIDSGFGWPARFLCVSSCICPSAELPCQCSKEKIQMLMPIATYSFFAKVAQTGTRMTGLDVAARGDNVTLAERHAR